VATPAAPSSFHHSEKREKIGAMQPGGPSNTKQTMTSLASSDDTSCLSGPKFKLSGDEKSTSANARKKADSSSGRKGGECEE